MPNRESATEIRGILRLSGRPLQSADDVAKYFAVPLGRLLWTLYRSPDDVRYRHFEIPKRSGGMRQIHAPVGLAGEDLRRSPSLMAAKGLSQTALTPGGYRGASFHVPSFTLAIASRCVAISMYSPLAQRLANER